MAAKYATGGAFGNLLKDPVFWQPAIGTAAALAVGSAGAAVGKLLAAKQKTRSYKEMLDMHPHLKKHDPSFVGRTYNTLYNVHPELVKDPMIAGAWIDTIAYSGGLDQQQQGRAILESVKELAQVRSHMSQASSRESSPGKAVGAFAKGMVDNTFAVARENEKQHGQVATLERQLGRTGDLLKKKVLRESGDVTERFLSLHKKDPAAAQRILDSIGDAYAGALKESQELTPGQRLIKACSK